MADACLEGAAMGKDGEVVDLETIAAKNEAEAEQAEKAEQETAE